MTKAGHKEKLPFSLRLKAWWEGYDVHDLSRRWQAIHGKKPAPKAPPADEAKPATAPEEAVVAEPEVPLRRPHMPWDQNRVDIAELVWGEGYCGPGGPENVIAMSKLLTLSPEMSMVVIGAELGGPARTLAQHFGVWISGYEENKELVDAGMAISERKGMGKKAPIHRYDFSEPAAFDRRFDRALAKECLFYVKEPVPLLTRIEESLKDDGLFLITNYILTEENMAFDPDVRTWMQNEPQPVYLQTHDEFVALLERCGFGIRVNEDITEQYRTLVANTWRQADQFVATLMQRGEAAKPLVDTLLKEAEMWTRRNTLLDQGKLQIWRILAHKKDVGHLMSDW